MEADPHQLIEGMIIAAHAIEADIAYIFLRGEYTLAAKRIQKALTEAYEAALSWKKYLRVRRAPRNVPTYQRGPVHVRRGNGFAECARRQTSEPARQTSIPAELRPMGKANYRAEHRDALQRSAHSCERAGVVQEAQPHPERGNQSSME